jgi:hypothetical protein
MEAVEKDNAIIGVYNSHREAVEALKILKHHKFPLKHVSIVGKGEDIKEINGVHTWEEATTKGTEIGALVGGTVGVLAGLSLITIPGIGLLYLGGGALGAFLGGVEGAAIGGAGGGIFGTIFGAFRGTEGSISGKQTTEDFSKYHDYIKEGKFLVIVNGPEEEVKLGHEILSNETHHFRVESHTSSLI